MLTSPPSHFLRFHKGACLLVTCLQPMPSLSLNLIGVFWLFSVRGFLAECIFHSLPPIHHAEKACDVCAEDQIKSTQLSFSAIREFWPCHSWRQAWKPNKERGNRFTSDPHRQVGVGVIHKQMDLKWVYLRHTQAFNGCIYCYWVSTLLHLFQELFLTCFSTKQGPDNKTREKTAAYEHNIFTFSFGDVLNVQAQRKKSKAVCLILQLAQWDVHAHEAIGCWVSCVQS